MVSAIEATRVEPKGSEPVAQSKSTTEKAADTAATGLFALLMAHLQNIAETAVEQGSVTAEGDIDSEAAGDTVTSLMPGVEKAAADSALALLVLPNAETLAAAAQAGVEPATKDGAEATGTAAMALVDVGEAQAGPPSTSAPTSTAKYVVTPPVATPEPVSEESEPETPAKEVTVSEADVSELSEPLATPVKPVLESKSKGAVEQNAPLAKPVASTVDVAQAQAEANAKADEVSSEFRETKPLAAAELLKQAVGSGARGEPADKALGVKGDESVPVATQRIDLGANVQTPSDVKESNGVGATTQKMDTPLQTERPTLQTLHEFTARGVRYLIREGGDTVTVRLVPESLGEVRFDVTRTQDTVSVRLVSANPAVRSVLESQVHGLRDQLAQDGFTVSQIVVTSDAASSNSQGGHFGNAWSDQTPAWRGSDPASNLNSARTQTYEAPVRRGAFHNGALDVFA